MMDRRFVQWLANWLQGRRTALTPALSPRRGSAPGLRITLSRVAASDRVTNAAADVSKQIASIALPLLGERAGVRAVQQRRSHPSFWMSVLIMVLLGAAGCSTPPKTSFRPAAAPFPAEALVTQRGVLTVLGRQFSLNGYLALSPTDGKRLVVTENFGSVLADVLITPDGVAHVMRSSRALKPKWIRRYLAADVQCLTGGGGATMEECPGQMLSSTHYLVQRRWYTLDLQTVNVKPGPQPATMFDASRAEKP
jgi:hypothetical protein